MLPIYSKFTQSLSESAQDVLKVDFCCPFLQFSKTSGYTVKAHFHLDGYVNEQKIRIWATKNPNTASEAPLHQQIPTAWCAVSAVAIVGSLFFANAVTIKRCNVWETIYSVSSRYEC
jgi:hypothetical protein